MSNLQKTISVLDTLMKESEEILSKAKGNAAAAVQQLQTRSDKLNEQNLAYRAELVKLSRSIFGFEEFFNVVHPMWGAVDSARKLLAMGKPAQASRMLDRAQSVWEREVFAFELDDFPQSVQTAFDRLVGQIDQLFVDAFAAIGAGEGHADNHLRRLLGKTDNLFDVCDDSLDALLDDLKAG
jgi:hypothetical protein